MEQMTVKDVIIEIKQYRFVMLTDGLILLLVSKAPAYRRAVYGGCLSHIIRQAYRDTVLLALYIT